MSKNPSPAFTPEQLRKLATTEDSREAAPEPPAFKVHRLEARLGPERVSDVVRRYESGASATAIAKDLGVAPSALLRLLSEKNVVVRKRELTPEQDAGLAREYEAGATMAELEKKHQLSHNTVSRALHRSGAEIRSRGRRGGRTQRFK